MRLGDSTDSFVSKDVEGEGKERVDFALIAFCHPPKTQMAFYNGISLYRHYLTQWLVLLLLLLLLITPNIKVCITGWQ